MRDNKGSDGTRGQERGESGDTVEYETRVSREGPSTGSRLAAARASRGYWIEPGGSAAPGGSVNLKRPGHRRRWVGFTVVLLLLAAIAIVAGLLVTGRIVVPVLSERLFPIRYQDDISRIAGEYGQDPYLVAAVVKSESGYDAGATSGKGAIGLMQLMPETAEWIASQLAWPEGRAVLTDPADNLELGVWYLDYLGDSYGDGNPLTLAAYNAGPGNLNKWIEAAGGLEAFDLTDIPFPETRQYVERVEHYYQLYQRIHPDVFGS